MKRTLASLIGATLSFFLTTANVLADEPAPASPVQKRSCASQELGNRKNAGTPCPQDGEQPPVADNRIEKMQEILRAFHEGTKTTDEINTMIRELNATETRPKP